MQPRDLSAHVEYVPGRGVEEVARDLGLDPEELVKLSSNENPHGASPAAVDAVRDAAADVSVYPKAAHTDLTAELAEKWGLSTDQVWVGPGADGAIDYLSRAMLDPDDPVLVPDPGFSYYGMSARYHHGDVRSYALSKADQFAMTADTVLDVYDGERVVFVTSPHNPTGATMAREEIEALLAGVDEETLVVVDEAYGEFAEEPSAAALLDGYDNLAVLRTFSKAYGLAGLRIGYALVPEAWADAYAKVSTPFAASEAALRAAIAALDDEAHVEKSVESAAWAREYVHEHLDAPTFDSEANFVLCEVGDGSAVAEAAQGQGVIVRDCSSFGLPGCIRVSCGTEDETRRAVETLNDVLADLEAPEA
ncbi:MULTISPECIES: histidinol-phosphate transaminase [Halolamina]|uniref:Histidinol-phosphate aminotransferase n=1 Tax=Halolamina pelagica TaxID=699431 RepID=A0A1I5MWW6_9EURY|nr:MULTISPECIES: histidinol-phosphate transaminase [Halolamina]NHX36198.1 histidinol-phosphate transaminase [Halolamina sp. R1-12]SFP14020.1 histidinol-phosphate aminotransferase [Halolamina pelagica]